MCAIWGCVGGSLSLSPEIFTWERKRPTRCRRTVFFLFFSLRWFMCKRMTLRNELQTCMCVCVCKGGLWREKCEREDRDREPNIRVNSTSPFFSRIKQKEKNATIFMTVTISPDELTWQVCRMNSNYSIHGEMDCRMIGFEGQMLGAFVLAHTTSFF